MDRVDCEQGEGINFGSKILKIVNHLETLSLLKRFQNDFENYFFFAELLNSYDTDRVLPLVEEMIAKSEPLLQVLRLISIQSQVCSGGADGGMKPKIYEQYKKEIVQV